MLQRENASQKKMRLIKKRLIALQILSHTISQKANLIERVTWLARDNFQTTLFVDG